MNHTRVKPGASFSQDFMLSVSESITFMRFD